MKPVECRNCSREVQDGAELCSACTLDLTRQLRGVPDLIDDLLLTLSKQDRLTNNAGGRSAETPLPLRMDIPEQIWVLGNVVTTWARDIAESAGLRVNVTIRRAPSALDSLRFAAVWLAAASGALRRSPDAGQAYDELTDAIAAANKACSAPPLRVFVGPCDIDGCTGKLYGWPDYRPIRCPECDHRHREMRQRWDMALYRLRGYPATAAVIARAAGELYGVIVNRKLINKWHERHQIRRVDDDPETGDPRFRIGEVLDRAKRSKPERGGGNASPESAIARRSRRELPRLR